MGVLHARGGDGDSRQQAEGAGGDAALAADDLLGRVRALTCGGDVDAGGDTLTSSTHAEALRLRPSVERETAQQAVRLGEHPSSRQAAKYQYTVLAGRHRRRHPPARLVQKHSTFAKAQVDGGHRLHTSATPPL